MELQISCCSLVARGRNPTHREGEGQTDRQSESERYRQTETERDTDRQKQRHTRRETKKETQRDTFRLLLLQRARDQNKSQVRKRALTTELCSEGWYSEHSGVCRRAEVPGRSVKVNSAITPASDKQNIMAGGHMHPHPPSPTAPVCKEHLLLIMWIYSDYKCLLA